MPGAGPWTGRLLFLFRARTLGAARPGLCNSFGVGGFERFVWKCFYLFWAYCVSRL